MTCFPRPPCGCISPSTRAGVASTVSQSSERSRSFSSWSGQKPSCPRCCFSASGGGACGAGSYLARRPVGFYWSSREGGDVRQRIGGQVGRKPEEQSKRIAIPGDRMGLACRGRSKRSVKKPCGGDWKV